MFAYACLETPIGTLQVVASERGLVEVQLIDARTAPTRYCQPSPATEQLSAARQQLVQYFAGERGVFSVPCAPEGTDFERAVWRELVHIPFGRTATYGNIAEMIGKSGAAQAVGQAVGANPLAIIVPCHRVVAANGLGGYGWGLEMKRWLLNHEQHVLTEHRAPKFAPAAATA